MGIFKKMKSVSSKTRIPSSLFGWDILTLILVLALVGILFERLLHPLMLDTAFEDLTARHRRIEARYLQGLSYLEDKTLIPYDEGAEIVLQNVRTQARHTLMSDRSVAHLALPSEIPDDLVLEAYGKREEGRLEFVSLSDERSVSELPPVFEEKRGQPVVVRLSRAGSSMIGTLSLTGRGLRKDMSRESEETVTPLLLMADREEEFFLRLNRVRILFWILLTAVLAVLLAVKLGETRKVARELRDIGDEILMHSNALVTKGKIGSEISKLDLKYQDTENLYHSFMRLNAGLERVGNILGGIADHDLYIATLREDYSLLDPHEVEMAILYLDVQGFTSISETHKAQALSIINHMWNKVEQSVYYNSGKINKFIGDACIAIFHEEDGDARLRSLSAAVQIITSVRELSAELNIEFAFRIGLDYGTVTYGKTGSENNFELGVIGDPVNTAARLEEMNKQYGTKLMLTEDMLKHPSLSIDKDLPVGSDYRLRFFNLDYVRPKGKKEPECIYTVVRVAEKGYALLGDSKVHSDKLYSAFELLTGKLRESISLWSHASVEEAVAMWKKLAVKFGRLSGRYGFSPAYPYVRSMLAYAELLRYEFDPAAWPGSSNIHIRPPEEDWITLGARELEK